MNTNLFHAALKQRGYTVESLATAIGMGKATLYKKLSGVSDFYREEIVAICKILEIGLLHMTAIFFADVVS